LTDYQKDLAAELEARRARFAHDGGPGSGPHPGGGKESSHATHPLPDKPGGKAIYDHPRHGQMSVEKEPAGSYYGQAENFDFSAPHAEGMRSKLRGWGARHVGWEHK
jgi:hypothetical protein